MVRILTKQPTALLNAFYVNGEFQIIGHWAIAYSDVLDR